MRISLLLLLLIAVSEFRAEVNGEATLIGCYFRGLDGIDDGRCGSSPIPKNTAQEGQSVAL